MAFYITQRPTDFLDKKGDPASFITELPPNRLLLDLGDAGSDATAIRVANFIQGTAGRKGWVNRADVTEATSEQVPRATLSKDDPDTLGPFVAECVARAWTANLLKDMAPFYADADYMIALALIQSDLQNPAALGAGKDRVGPFGVTAAEWKTFTETPFDGHQYQDYEIDLPLFQVACAAFQMHVDAKALSAKWQEKGVGTAADPYLPRFGELLRCRLVGVDLAFAMQVKLKDDLGSQMLPAFFDEAGLAKTAANALMKDRCRFMRAGESPTGDPVSLQVFDHKCDEVLNAALKSAFDLIKQFVPEAIEQATGEAPWMKVAAKELKAGINESTDEGRKKIAQYFQSTGFTQGTAADKWCAAFVAWCMDQCGTEIADTFAAFRNEAASSAKWRDWGDVEVNLRGDAPVGAVVVLSPSKQTDEISHVGFFKEYHDDKRKVTILGGNQSNAVCEIDFDADDVIELRWLSSLAGAAGPASGEKPVANATIPATQNDVLILARTIFGEARSLNTAGRQAVAAVMLNRLKKKFRGKKTIADVCLDPRQFSCWNLDDPNRAQIIDKLPNKGNADFDGCFAVANDAVKGAFPDPTGGAMHYYAKSMSSPPFWVTESPNARMTFEDAGHRFYIGIR